MNDVVLIADNDPDFLDTRAEFLEQVGYHVLKACSLEQTRQLLTSARVHLAILDVRMVDDDDERDKSGLTLAKDPAYHSVPKIILTNFPSYQDVREALKPDLAGLSPAVDFVAKKEEPEAMIQAAKHILAQHARINWNLQIQWGQRERASFLHLASLIQPDLPNEILTHRADELEDLFRRLFYDYQQIRIGQLFWHDRWRFCLSVLAQSSQGAIDPRIVVCGERERLEQELEQMQKLAPKTAQGIKLESETETMYFGAAAYVLPDANVETVYSLRALFQQGRERSFKTALDYLLKETLTAWHERGQTVKETQDLMSLYRQWAGLGEGGLSRLEVERRIEALVQATRPLSAVEVQRDDGKVTFKFPNQVPLICPDPVATVYAPLEEYVTSVVCRVSPGQLTADNVLIDAERRTWLTEFAQAGQAPQWWDFVCLEAAIRFDLSQAPDLLAWLEFEECLVTPSWLHDRLRTQDVISDLQANMTLIEQIRRQAGSKTGPETLPYYAGLLAWIVGVMAQYDPDTLYTQAERMRGAHLLLAGAMLAHRLGETIPTSPVEGVLRLDSDGVVWIGDHRACELVGQELILFRCLYGKQGQVLSRQAIVESVFGEKYIAGDRHQEGRINSLIRRLREDVEPNPDRQQYILTARGKGYRLQIDGELHRR